MNAMRYITTLLLLMVTSSMLFSSAYAGPVVQDDPTPGLTLAVPGTPRPTGVVDPAQTPLPTEIPTQVPTEPPTETQVPTETAPPTIPPTAPSTETQMPPATPPQEEITPTATSTSPPTPSSQRPIVVILSYKTKPSPVAAGGNFVLNINVENQGQIDAKNLVITFTPGDFLPRETGGVLAISQLGPDDDRSVKQPFVVASALQGQNVSTLAASINYMDEFGNAYSESFTFTIGIEKAVTGGSGANPTPTPTAAEVSRPQLVIAGYSTDVAQLNPGAQFNLELSVLNAGNADAKRVTMIVGGAATVPTTEGNDTPMPPGYSASGGEFTNFSPLGVSNVHYLGDLDHGDTLSGRQPLIVNVSTNPGVYSLKISFAYNDEKGNLLIDDQVISLLVFSPPVVEISFYRDPGPLFAGQPNMLPLQIVNLGRKSAVLGNMRVTAENGLLENSTVLVGPLEAGNYYTLDATLIPNVPGLTTLQVSVDFNDDFNQPQTVMQEISIEVLEAPPPVEEPGMEPGTDPGMGAPPDAQSETFWQKAVRFLRGLVGLDSGRPVMVEGPAAGPLEGPPGMDGMPIQ